MYTRFTLALVLLSIPEIAPAQETAPRHTYVIVHGAWGGSWDWKVVDSLLTARGQVAYRPALTGLGERVHLSSPSIGLSLHIEDVVNTILWEQLDDVILIGHSYGGMVITGVADRIPDRIQRLVYLDAFVPDSGESLADILPASLGDLVRHGTDSGMVTAPWIQATRPIPRDVAHPLRTFIDPLHLTNPARNALPATYILTVERGQPVDDFEPFADRAKARGWNVRQLTADHVPERSAPEPLVDLLLSLDPASPNTSRSGALFEALARMDSLLFDAAFVSCDNRRIDSILAGDIEFVHDQSGFKSGAAVRADFTRLTGNCPRHQGVRRELIPGSLEVFPINNYGAVQRGMHRFIDRDAATSTVAQFVHLWMTSPEGEWRLARVLSFDHHPAP